MKNKITLTIQQKLLSTHLLPLGGLVSLFKMHGNNNQEFHAILRDIPRASELIKQDKLFLENNNIDWEERCNLLKEAHFMEEVFQQNKILNELWTPLVKQTSKAWNMQDSSGNANSIYNLLLENQIVNGAQIFFIHCNTLIVNIHKSIPSHFKIQLQYINSEGKIIQRTPDVLATHANTLILKSENVLDIKSHYLDVTKYYRFYQYKNFYPCPLHYTLIHHTLMSHDKFTQYLLTSKNFFEVGALLYCPKLDSILKAQTKISPITKTEVPGWYNFITDSFKPFKDIILP
jgi:hypothetical protein